MGKLGQVRSALLKGTHKVQKPKAPEQPSKPLKKKEDKKVVEKKNVVFKWSDGASSRLPFSTSMRVLCVGEGDGSFAWSLHALGVPVIPTMYDSEDDFKGKYPPTFLDHLKKEGVKVYFDVDATKSLASRFEYDMIVWNFPHTGQGITDRDHNILSQQKLLCAFFSSNSTTKSPKPIYSMSMADDNYARALPMVHNNELERKPPCSVMLTLWCGEPYDSWNVKKIAAEHGWKCQVSFPFQPALYPEYQHVLTKGSQHHIPNVKDARSYIFVVQ